MRSMAAAAAAAAAAAGDGVPDPVVAAHYHNFLWAVVRDANSLRGLRTAPESSLSYRRADGGGGPRIEVRCEWSACVGHWKWAEENRPDGDVPPAEVYKFEAAGFRAWEQRLLGDAAALDACLDNSSGALRRVQCALYLAARVAAWGFLRDDDYNSLDTLRMDCHGVLATFQQCVLAHWRTKDELEVDVCSSVGTAPLACRHRYTSLCRCLCLSSVAVVVSLSLLCRCFCRSALIDLICSVPLLLRWCARATLLGRP